MKLDNTNSNKIRNDNSKVLGNGAPAPGKTPPEWHVLDFLAQMCDLIAEGKNMYVVIGSTQDKTALTFSIKGDLGAKTLFAGSLAELGLQLKPLL